MKRLTRWLLAPALVVGSPVVLLAQKVMAPTGIKFAYTTSALTISWTNVAHATQYAVNRRQPQQTLGVVATSRIAGRCRRGAWRTSTRS